MMRTTALRLYIQDCQKLADKLKTAQHIAVIGGGWIGFDPTTGNIVGTDHIAIAVSRLPDNVPPIAGSFVGISDSTLSVGVWVTKI